MLCLLLLRCFSCIPPQILYAQSFSPLSISLSFTFYELVLLFNLLHLSNYVSLSFCPRPSPSLYMPLLISLRPRHITCRWRFELSRTFSGSWSHSWQPSALFCHLSWGISCTHRPCLSAVPLPGTARRTPSCEENSNMCLPFYKLHLCQGVHIHDIQRRKK